MNVKDYPKCKHCGGKTEISVVYKDSIFVFVCNYGHKTQVNQVVYNAEA